MKEGEQGLPAPSLVEERARGWLARCQRAGAEEAEVYVKFSHTRRLATPAGRPIQGEERIEAGVALRVFRGEHRGFSVSSWCESYPPLGDLRPIPLGRTRNRWLPTAPIRCLEFARAAEPVESVKHAEKATGLDADLTSSVIEEYIFNTHGVAIGMSGALCTLETRHGAFIDTLVSRDLKGLDPALLSREQIGPEQVELPTAFVLAPRASAQIASLLSQSLRADRVAAGRSWIGARDQNQVRFSPALTAVVDGREGPFGRPFDGEGVPASKVELVVNGRLFSLLYDTRTALMAGRRSTASCVRHSYRELPSIGSQCFSISGGDSSIEELREHARLEITRLSPLGRWDRQTGNLSFPAYGYMLCGRRRQRPIQTVLEGGLISLLKDVENCAGDVTGFLHDGWCAAPSMLIRRRACSGIAHAATSTQHYTKCLARMNSSVVPAISAAEQRALLKMR